MHAKTPHFLAVLCATLLQLTLLQACRAEAPAAPEPDFSSYWYQGEAEITSYDLEQARYGEIHPGHAVTIFVTEDFSRSKHVKLDRPSVAGDDAVKVLKLNATRNFNTGIYPYSMMMSAFTPVDARGPAETLKVTTSSQEWCGHTFTQIDRTAEGYHVDMRSYFESEGDIEVDLPGVVLEDELWALLRIDPALLPIGDLDVIPGSMFQRLSHLPWTAAKATASLADAAPDDTSSGDAADSKGRVFRLDYTDIGRSLEIHFERQSPYRITSWQETTTSRGQTLTTRATLKARIMTPYWSQNSVADGPLRQQLGLP